VISQVCSKVGKFILFSQCSILLDKLWYRHGMSRVSKADKCHRIKC